MRKEHPIVYEQTRLSPLRAWGARAFIRDSVGVRERDIMDCVCVFFAQPTYVYRPRMLDPKTRFVECAVVALIAIFVVAAATCCCGQVAAAAGCCVCQCFGCCCCCCCCCCNSTGLLTVVGARLVGFRIASLGSKQCQRPEWSLIPKLVVCGKQS